MEHEWLVFGKPACRSQTVSFIAFDEFNVVARLFIDYCKGYVELRCWSGGFCRVEDVFSRAEVLLSVANYAGKYFRGNRRHDI